jgi:hypothetical protein
MTTEVLSSGPDQLWEALLRLGVNLANLLIIIRVLYYRFSNKKGNIFAFFLMGIMIFTVCILLKGVEFQMGMVLGLFAIFSIVRFRSMNMEIKDLSYLFAVIGISAINALFDFPHPVRGTIIVNAIVIITILILELSFKSPDTKSEKKREGKKEKKKDKRKDKKKSFGKHQIVYDNLKLLNPDKKDDLLKDISTRTGIKIEKVRIKKIDLTSGNADLIVSFRKKPEITEL